MKVVIIGGGSTYTPELMEGFIRLSHLVQDLSITLVDTDVQKMNTVYEFLKRMINASDAKIELSKTTNLEETLPGADFVINQVRIGGNRARLMDETVPLQFGVLGQETTGPGGFANALRTIPVVLSIAKQVQEHCPKAWFINFTNPSGIVTEALLKYSTVKAIGLCNSPINFCNMFARMFDVTAEDVFLDYFGLNHLSFVRKVFVNGKDVTTEALAKLPLSNEEQRIVKYLGMFPNYYLRYYYLREEKVKEAMEKPKRAEEVLKIEQELLTLYKDPTLAEKPPQLSKRGGAFYSTAAVNLIEHLCGFKRGFQIINVMNNGAIKDLPDDAVVEIPVYIDGSLLKPYMIGTLPTTVRGTIQAVKAYEQLTIEAAIEGSYSKAVMALAQHPLVSSISLAEKILDALMDANAGLFPTLI
ncbi:6-phospho-beta-glucosidase [Caldicoprobacter guelmensis]|uniref:6-phospho-beta-glucosidase n=1 Tax=Caldicoprobacter guelmensis TaxID=1170224 RepID=UPI001959C597|nr:6-phospho-beta-glucosidase [Caldicoprobacter guelmensis]MBM7583184.1 6-phospho-beta-glucosidase [Caldicoprobacter guelmensis]